MKLNGWEKMQNFKREPKFREKYKTGGANYHLLYKGQLFQGTLIFTVTMSPLVGPRKIYSHHSLETFEFAHFCGRKYFLVRPTGELSINECVRTTSTNKFIRSRRESELNEKKDDRQGETHRREMADTLFRSNIFSNACGPTSLKLPVTMAG